MSDLTDARDHARAMAARTSDPNAGVRQCAARGRARCHSGSCGGCAVDAAHIPTDTERALWTRLADEIDDYLTPADDGPGLWED